MHASEVGKPIIAFSGIVDTLAILQEEPGDTNEKRSFFEFAYRAYRIVKVNPLRPKHGRRRSIFDGTNIGKIEPLIAFNEKRNGYK